MTDFRAILATLRRPRLLIRAARLGMEDYRRDRDLGRLTDCATPESALPRLLEQEDALERTRISGDAAYSVTRHVDVMIALMAEVRMQPRPAPTLTLV